MSVTRKPNSNVGGKMAANLDAANQASSAPLAPEKDPRAVAQPGRPDYPIIAWMLGVHLIAAYGIIWHFSWGGVLALVITHFMGACLGITLGYHRLLTHRSYKAPRWVERVLATFGVFALQGSPLEWIAHHRMHHSFVDAPKDPHNARLGFWHSHMGWLFKVVDEFDDDKRLRRFARDIVADPYLMWLGRPEVIIGLQVVAGLAMWAAFGYGIMLWGVFVRLAFSYHATWLVNSATHQWGYRNYESDDLSRNNWFVALVAWGEGWHNNHHMYQDVAPAGHKWWEVDVTYMVIRLMKRLGLATDVRTMETLALEMAEEKKRTLETVPVTSI